MITSGVYRLSRLELAYLTCEEYLRNYWWFAATVPIGGLGLMIFGQGPMVALGMLAFLWPFSIPARGIIFTTKSSRLFANGCHVEATIEDVNIIGEYKDGKRLRYPVATNRLKSVLRRKGMIILRTRMPGFLAVKESAFSSEEEIQGFVDLMNEAIDRWQKMAMAIDQ